LSIRTLPARVRSERTRSQLQLAVRLAGRQISMRYRESVFGAAWAVLNPLLLLLIYWIVFAKVFQSKWTGPEADRPYALIIFCGIIVFNLYAEIVNSSLFLVQGNSLLIKRTTVSSRVLPIASSLAALFTFTINLVPFFIVYLALEHAPPPATALLLPLIIGPLVVMSTGIAMVLASVSAYLRDTQQVVPLFNTALFFMSPIFYPGNRLPGAMAAVSEKLTPVGHVLVTARRLLFVGELPLLRPTLLYCAGAAVIFAIGWVVYGAASKGFGDVV
jgi:lipopolysaccharide transport system permease protein